MNARIANARNYLLATINMSNHITVGLKQARALCAAGWKEPTEFYWAYGPDRLIGKIWRVYHVSEEVHSIDQKDIIPAAPTAEELWKFIQSRLSIASISIIRGEKIANNLAGYVLKNNLLKL